MKKAIKVSAPEYVDYLMTWVQNQLDDETIFPSKIGVPFPKNFQQIVKNVSFVYYLPIKGETLVFPRRLWTMQDIQAII